MRVHINQSAAALEQDLFTKKDIEADAAEAFLEPPQVVTAMSMGGCPDT
ncbi:MAG: hypothetical protein ABGX07_09410 [Pirellulaceae bacterium]